MGVDLCLYGGSSFFVCGLFFDKENMDQLTIVLAILAVIGWAGVAYLWWSDRATRRGRTADR